MAFEEYTSYDGLGLAELVRQGEITPLELVEEAIARCERHNPKLNFLVYPMYDLARAAATAPTDEDVDAEQPFRGVPFVLKDLLGDYEGVPTTFATKALQGVPAPEDAELTKRYKRAGLIAVGKTNVPEIGTMPTTEPAVYGPCHNPWNLDHSTGGSSGGSAAAVAAGCVPIGHANDGGGSIRIPASCCGLVGMKPTRARNPLGPRFGDMYSGLIQEHVVTRTVRDSAAVLDCTAGPDVGDPYWAPPQERPYLEEVGTPPGSLRIATWDRAPDGSAIHRECRKAVEETAKLLTDLGHRVEEEPLPVTPEQLNEPFTAIWAAGATATLDAIAMATGKPARAEDYERLTWTFYEIGRTITAAQYMMAVTQIQAHSRTVARFFERYDVWVSPTLAAPPVRLGELDPNTDDVPGLIQKLYGYLPFTAVFNATGQPAVSLPLYWSADGLPIGVQLAGRFGAEGTLYRLAAQLEEARPWRDRKPPVWG